MAEGVRFNDIELNAWQTTYEMGQFCPNTKIVHSSFVFYYPDEQMIVDKTAEPVDKNKDLLGRIRKQSKNLLKHLSLTTSRWGCWNQRSNCNQSQGELKWD